MGFVGFLAAEAFVAAAAVVVDDGDDDVEGGLGGVVMGEGLVLD